MDNFDWTLADEGAALMDEGGKQYHAGMRKLGLGLLEIRRKTDDNETFGAKVVERYGWLAERKDRKPFVGAVLALARLDEDAWISSIMEFPTALSPIYLRQRVGDWMPQWKEIMADERSGQESCTLDNDPAQPDETPDSVPESAEEQVPVDDDEEKSHPEVTAQSVLAKKAGLEDAKVISRWFLQKNTRTTLAKVPKKALRILATLIREGRLPGKPTERHVRSLQGPKVMKLLNPEYSGARAFCKNATHFANRIYEIDGRTEPELETESETAPVDPRMIRWYDRVVWPRNDGIPYETAHAAATWVESFCKELMIANKRSAAHTGHCLTQWSRYMDDDSMWCRVVIEMGSAMFHLHNKEPEQPNIPPRHTLLVAD